VLLFGSVVAPASLAALPVESCTMGCVENEEGGVCCCIRERRERLAEHRHNQEPGLAQFSKDCPSNCATAPSSGNPFSAAGTSAVGHAADLQPAAVNPPRRLTPTPQSHFQTVSHERAPPSSLSSIKA
jgi:hypothetical protein